MADSALRSSDIDRLWPVSGPVPEGPTILLVEPDDGVAAGIALMLASEGFRSIVARSADEAMAQVSTADPSVVLVDYELPDAGGGPSLCRRIRTLGRTPVIVFSRSRGETFALASFDAGADDFMSQPTRLRELAARIRAALRRVPPRARPDKATLVIGDVELDVERHLVRVGGRPLTLPLREFELLSVLLSSAGKTWSRVALMRRVWGELPPSGTKSLDVHVKRIRDRIENDPSAPTRILTVRGVGYRYATSTPKLGPPT